MEFASRIRWILVVAVAVIALILVTWGLFTIASNIFRGGEDSGLIDDGISNTQVVESSAVASYEVRGPVVANQDQRSYLITVSQNVVSMKSFSNYGQNLINEQNYQNTQEAFDTFLSALANLEVTDTSRNATDELGFEELGVCPAGRKFIVTLDTSLVRWSTSCSRNEGNAGFNMGAVGNLFRRQIPDFSDLNRGSGI